MVSEDLTCSGLLRATGAGIAGTASANTWAWICVEVRAQWGRKGLGDTELPPAVEAMLVELQAMPGARVQFIRRPRRADPEPVVVLLADGFPGRERMAELELATLDELVHHDVRGFFEDGLELGSPVHEPRYLVCTHGRRDACCARLGIGVWCQFDQQAPEQTWQTSHIGGHRYAPTLTVLPEGVCFGQVEQDEVSALIAAWEDGRIHDATRVRGRSVYTAAGQAAEVLSGAMVRAAPRWLDADDRGDGLAFHIQPQVGADLRLQLERVEVGRAEASCGTGKVKPIVEWRRAT